MSEVLKKLFLMIAVIAIYILSCVELNLLANGRQWPIVDEMPKKPAGINTTSQVGDMLSFYPRVATLMSSQEKIDTKIIECSKSLGLFRGYFTLARPEDNRAVFFVFTDKGPITDLNQVFPEPGSLDWGYIYDRNGDGWVDYFTYLDNALPVKTEEILDLIPDKSGYKPDEGIPIDSKKELMLIVKHSQLVFTHNADDNFDGKTDGVVAAVWDSQNPIWIYGNAVLRSRAYTQEIDDDWRFFSDIKTRAESVPRTSKGNYNISFYMGSNPLEMSSEIMKSINKGIRKCRLPKGILPKE